MAGEVQLKLQTTLDLAFLQTQLSSLSTLAQKVNFAIAPTLNVAQLKKDLRKVEREFRLQIGDSQVQGAIGRLDTLSRKLTELENKKIKIGVEPSVNIGNFKKTLKSKLSGLTIEVDVVAGNIKQQASNQGFAAIDAIERVLAQGKSGQAFRGPVQQAQENIVKKGILQRLERESLKKGGYNVPGVQKIITTLGGIPRKGASRAELVDQAKKLVKEADNVADSVLETLKDMQMALKPIRSTGAMPGSFFAARSAGNYQDIISSMAGLTKNPRAAGLMLRQLPEQRIRTGLLDKATQQAQYYENVPLAREIQRSTRGFDPLLKAIAEEFTDYTKSLNPTNPWVGKIGDGLRKVTAVASVAAGQKALPPVGGTTSPVNRLISQLAGARGGIGGAQTSALFAARSNALPGIRMPGMTGTLPGLEKLANSLALLSNNALKARRSIEEVGLQNLPTAITGLKGAAFDSMLNQAVLRQRGIQPFAGQSAPIFVPTQGPARPSTVTYPLTARGRFDRTGIGAGAGSFIPPLTNAYSFPMSGMMGPFSSLPPRGSMGQFPMAGMMYPSSPLGQINAQTSMFGPSGPFGPGNRPPGGFYRGGGAPGGGGQVPSGGFPSAGPMGPQTQLGGGYLAVGQAINNFQKAYSGARQYLDKNRLPLGGAIAEIASEFGNAVKQVLLFGTAYKALAFFVDLPNQAFEAAKSLATYENQLKAVTSTTGTFEQSFSFVDGLAQRFNVPLESARQGFVKLYASMQPAGFDQTQIEGLFTGISKATAAFGLSADKVDRVNYAFAQMASKGQIMSEELKGQLGDVLPGALALFARAAQMSIPEFSKAMEDGAFKGKAMQQVLGNVAILMNRDFGPAAQGAAKTLQGALTQMQNNLKLMYESMAPIVNAFAAAFGPQVNSLIKDVTSVMKVLTSTFVDGAKATESLSPRALALYNTIEKLRPSFVNAGAALSELGSRMASLAPVFVQVLKLTLDFIASPLGRAAIVATIAITSLNAALAALSAIGLTGAIKGIYSFIGGLLKIPQATGIARIAVIGLKLAITGIFVVAVLTGLDFVIGKIIEIGTASSKSKDKVRGLSQELDLIASSADVNEASKKYLEANTRLAMARQKNEKALKDLSKAQQEVTSGRGLGVEGKPAQALAEMRLQNARIVADEAYEEVIAAQKQVQAANKTRANAVKQQQQQRQQTEQQLKKIDLQGAEGKGKKTSLEGYYSLEDQLAKNFTEEQIRRLEEEFRHKVELMNAYYDLQEARANSFQKDALRFEREMMQISAKRQEALLKASLDVMSARGSVAGPSAMGQATGGKSLGAGIAQYITGDPSSPFYRADHGGSNYHEHLAFVSRQAAEEAYRKLTSAGIQVTEFKGRSRVGRHTAGSAHYSGLAFDVPAAQVPVGRERELTARVQSILGIGGGGVSAGAPRKVTGNEKRDVIAQQKEQLAIAKQSVVARQAEELALKQSEIALRNYIAAILPTEEQALQNNLLSRRNDLIAAGTPEDVIERELKLFENQEKVRYGIEAVNRLRQQGVYRDKQAKAAIDELNNGLSLQNKLLRDNFMLQRAGKFNEAMRDLGQRRDILSAPLGQERLVELRQQGYSEEQAQQLFQVEELIGKMERLRGAVKGVADGINSSLGTALVDSVLKFDSLNEVASNFLNSVAGYFRDLANTIIQEMTRAFINKAVQSLLGNILNIALPGAGSLLTAGLSGGFSTASAFSMAPGAIPAAGGITMPSFTGGIAGGIQGFANGGMVTGPTLGLVGEGRYNEAIVPLPNGKSIPVELGGAAGNQIVSNITVNVNNGQTQSNATGANSSELGRKLEGAVKQVIVGELRPGGLLSR